MSKIFTRNKTGSRQFNYESLMPIILIGIVSVIILIFLVRAYLFVSVPNVVLHGKPSVYFYIPTGSTFNSVNRDLIRSGYLRDQRSFEWTAIRMHYQEKIRPGRYRLSEGMNNRQLVSMLRIGQQVPVRMILTGARSKEELAGKISRQLEPDSLKLIRLLNDPSFLARFGLTPATVFSLFIPDTYEIYWNTSPADFFLRMYREYKRFWYGAREKKSDSLGFSIPEIVTLASIIEKETNTNREKPIIAGVYINRLKKHIPLQADPTVIFAWKDYSIRRVLRSHLELESPYNTYKYQGLPPGPICIPSVSSIDAVLNYGNHDYLYFCAKEDFSGSHVFAVTLAEHNRNALRYQEALNKKNIR